MQQVQARTTVNLADLPLVTLDYNALIAVREHEPAEGAVNELLAMNRAGQIVINITLSTGLEAGRHGERLEWPELIAWLKCLEITENNIFTMVCPQIGARLHDSRAMS